MMMTTKPVATIGLLPHSLELYDQVLDESGRTRLRSFAGVIKAEYEPRGVRTIAVDACRVADEFRKAVEQFEQEGVDAIVVLHLAYSPSLESIDALAATKLPLILLDTTPDFDFGYGQVREQVLVNHGIHGVQDLCNLLLRRGKSFLIEAGHWKESDVVDRTVTAIQGCHAACAFRSSRVGLIGKPFAGMGDFAVPFELLKERFGIDVVAADSEAIAQHMPSIDSPEVQAEMAADLERFDSKDIDGERHAASVAAGLAVRQWIEREGLSAFTMNFGDITGRPGLPVVPFLEAGKAMARGIGYAGEGDVLTAAFCGAIAKTMPETTFTEMFCPDWKGERIYMAHMGEVNVDITAEAPTLRVLPYRYSQAEDPVIAVGCLKPGDATLLNAAPGPDDSFSLIALPLEVCDTGGREKIDTSVRGWIRPPIPIPECLERYSRLGGTHHSVLSYGVAQGFVTAFAHALDWPLHVID